MTITFSRRPATVGGLLFLTLMLVLPSAAYADAVPLLEWRFKTKHDASNVPATTVSLRVNNNMEFVIEPMARAAFHVVEPRDFEAHDVPNSALAACSGWWAGAGDEYYAAFDHRHNKALVYHRTLDEGATTERYKLLRRLPVTVRITR